MRSLAGSPATGTCDVSYQGAPATYGRIGRAKIVVMSPPSRGTFTVLKVRDFRLLWIGQTISSFGDGIFTIALALTALNLGKGATGLSLVIIARSIPSVGLLVIGGAMSDRIPRRVAMLGSDFVRGAAVGIVALLLAANALRLWELILMSVVFGTADALFGPASMAFVPELVDEKQLIQANSLSQLSSQITQALIGPAAGGLIVAFIGYSWSMGIDAISFFLSAFCLVLIRTRSKVRSTNESVFADVKEGFNFIRRRGWLLATLIAGSLANFFAWFPLAVLLPLFVRTNLHGSAQSLGLILAAGGATGIIATLVVARTGSPRRYMTVMWTAYTIGCLAIVGMALARNLWVLGMLSATEVGLFLYGDILYVSMMQKLIPKEVLGRVFSVALALSLGLGPLSFLLAGVMATAIGIRWTMFIGGLIAACIDIWVLFLPSVREAERIGAT
jgi:MFS family permease